jgi:hypothetical protein
MFDMGVSCFYSPANPTIFTRMKMAIPLPTLRGNGLEMAGSGKPQK